MQDDATQKAAQPDSTNRAAAKIDDLSEQPISDGDAQSVKGGLRRSHDDESPKESR